MGIIEMQAAMGASLLTILVATVGAWLFGALWYGLLSKPWMAASGITQEMLEADKAKPALQRASPFIISFVLEFVMAYMLAVLLMHTAPDGFSFGGALMAAFFLWLGFIATTQTINHRYHFQTWSLTVIDCGHWLGVMLVMAAIMAVMGL